MSFMKSVFFQLEKYVLKVILLFELRTKLLAVMINLILHFNSARAVLFTFLVHAPASF